ncbi:MAG: hypothetical protein DDT31_00016 [Syntrophomonadaceae bacterium]|nr:hypothetical protein [Bacillota bacterium]
MTTPLNKSSVYVQSLVSFILDTKPYHSKLTEIIEEYRFEDELNVRIKEASFTRTHHKAAWIYDFFSSGPGSDSTFRTQQVLSPDFAGLKHNSDQANNFGKWKANRDENIDMAQVPLVFSKKRFDGVGIADAWMERNGTKFMPYVEGHDYFQSHGSFEFQIKRIFNHQTSLMPTWAETRTDRVVTNATVTAQTLEYDRNRPQSAINKLITLVTNIQLHIKNNNILYNPPKHTINSYGINSASTINSYGQWRILAIDSCRTLLALLHNNIIPPMWTTATGNPDLVLSGDYSKIVYGAHASAIPPPPGFDGWIRERNLPQHRRYVSEEFIALLPPLMMGMHTDIGLHKNGVIEYNDINSISISVHNITANPNAVYEEWTISSISPADSTWAVTGSHSGFIGIATTSVPFVSSSISFKTTARDRHSDGEIVMLTPSNQITIHPSAPLETWNIIKINPKAYTRPAFISTNYGHIYDLKAVRGSVSLLGEVRSAGTYVLRALNATTFSVSYSADPSYSGTATVNSVYNDGHLGFTIVPGVVQQFQIGDYFLIQAANNIDSRTRNFGLYYGYDLDSYDNPDLVYNNLEPLHPDFNRFINFRFDSRFNDYDVATMGLVIAPYAVNGRSFRLRAIPDMTRPIATLKRDGTTISNAVDLTAGNNEIAPVNITGVPVFTLPGDINPAADIELYYSTSFLLEYSDNGFETTTTVDSISVGDNYSNPDLGISFILQPGSKPFIAVSSDIGLDAPRIEGGDIFFFNIHNPPPILENAPIGLSGATAPRLIMHGDSYYASVSANWVITITSPITYSINGTYNSGPLSGVQVSGYPRVGTLSLITTNIIANTTYKDSNLHFTIVVGHGLYVGDSFTFQTNDRRASFLVHGSVSGWHPDAQYDEWYFNGKIGFKIKSPVVKAYEAFDVLERSNPAWPNTNYPNLIPEVLGYHNYLPGHLKINYIRPDAPANTYLFQRNNSQTTSGGFMVRRSDIGVQGFCPQNGIYEDKYISIEVQDIMDDFQFSIAPSEFDFWNAQDTVIIRSNISILNPVNDDFIVIKKAEEGTFAINLDYRGLITPPDLSALSLLSVNVVHTDFTTGFGSVPLDKTSPETAANFLTGWIPTYIRKLDTPVSVAEFPDTATIFEMRSAQSNQIIGTLQSLGGSLGEPTNFQFDTTFFNTYLPINAKTGLVTYGTGLNDKVRVMISEKLNFMLMGLAIFEKSQFNDNVFIDIEGADQKHISLKPQGNISTIIGDSFVGFLPGYDNLEYDEELPPDGFYGIGTPLTDYFIEAQQLAGIIPLNSVQLTMTPTQRMHRQDILQGLLGNYLISGSILLTTLAQFLDAVNNSNPVNYNTVSRGFGNPAQGMAMSINSNPSTDTNNTSIQEGFSIQLRDLTSPNVYGERSVILYSMGPPPVGVAGGDYVTTVTPLEVVGNPVRIFEVVFVNAPQGMATPTFQLWAPGDISPRSVGQVQTVSNGRFRFIVPEPLEAKIVVI